MKFFKKLFILSIVCIITIVACTKEIDIIISFPFNLEASHEEMATINYQEKTTITINPEQVITGNVYEFTYKIIQGEGHFEGAEGEAIPEDIWIVSENLSLTFDFVGTLIGDVEIEFTVRDQEGEIETITLIYEVIHNPFVWEVNTSGSELTINNTSPFSMILTNTGKDKSITYERRIYFEEGAGELSYINLLGNETPVELDVLEVMEEGVYQASIKLSETGFHKIFFEVTDSNGQVKLDSLTYQVNVVDFTFEGAPQSETLFVGGKTNLNFLIQELLGGNDVYESRFVFNSGNATITRTFNGTTEEVIPENLYPVNLDRYYWDFLATEVGTIDMTFYVINASGVEKEVNIIIEVANGTFDFNVFQSEDRVLVNEAVVVTFSIDEYGQTGVPYTVTYNSNLDGFLTYNNVVYSPGDDITITELNFIATYTGEALGDHVISFEATNTFGETKASNPETLSIRFIEDGFNFIASAENGNVLLNDSTHFIFNIADGDEFASTYLISYTVTGTGEGVLSVGGTIFEPDVMYDITRGTTSWEFDATTVGDLEYTFTIINSSGRIISDNVNIIVSSTIDSDFNFIAVEETASQIINQDAYINLTIDETTNPGTAGYSMMFTTTGTGTVTYLGIEYNEGEIINVSPVNFTVSYNGTSVEAHTVEFTVVNDNAVPVSKIDSVVINFTHVGYDFSVVDDGDPYMYINGTEVFNMSLTQLQFDPTVTYNVTYVMTGDGTGFISGLTSGQSIPLGNTSVQFIAESIGTVNIEITITDSNGQTKSRTISYYISEIGFTVSTSSGTFLYIKETKPFDVLLSLDEIDPAITYSVVYTIIGSGTIESSTGFPLTSGTSYPITQGTTSLNFIGVDPGTTEITVTVTDSNGQVNPPIPNIVFTVYDIIYLFTAQDNTDVIAHTINSGDSVALDFKIAEAPPGGSSSVYTIKYAVPSSGKITEGGSARAPDTYHPASTGSFSWNFEAPTIIAPAPAEDIIIVFTVLNSVTLEEQVVTVTVTVNPVP